MPLLLDACALIAYLRDEPGAERVEAILLAGSDPVWIHSINLAEVYYGALVRDGENPAKQMLTEVAQLGIVIREDVTEPVWKGAAECKWIIKEETRRPESQQKDGSFADCFCAAYAKFNNAEVVTTDHGEFDFLTRVNFCRAQFIR